jgi:hypothetical protein
MASFRMISLSLVKQHLYACAPQPLVSFRVWDDLVNEAGMAPERYAEIVTTAVLATLAAPVRRARR